MGRDNSVLIKWIFAALFFFFSVISVHAEPMDDAKSWLSVKINSGLLSSDLNSTHNALALDYQAAKESVLAMDHAGASAMLDWQMLLLLFSTLKESNTTEYLSAFIIAHTLSGDDTSTYMQTLLGMQHADGGFGTLDTYVSSPLDTALVLEAFHVFPENTIQIESAINYLLAWQKDDGSWQITEEDKLYTTAVVLRALWLHRKSYNVQVAIEHAKSYLVAQKHTDGSYGSETFETALVLRSIAPLTYEKSTIQDTIDYLYALQQPSGSWEEDIYTTALVIDALVAADMPVPNPDLSALSGTVVDAESNLPLEGIEVRLIADENLTVVTASNGGFFFEGLKNGTYTLLIADSNYAPLQTTLHFSGEDIDLGTIRLNKNTDATVSSLTGTIKDEKNGLLLSGVSVTLNDKAVTTGADGIYLFDNIDPGNYVFKAAKTGYYQVTRSLQIDTNTRYTFDLLLEQVIPSDDDNATDGNDANTTLPSEPMIFGTVYDRSTHAALPLTFVRAKVNGIESSQASDLNGSYMLELSSFGTVDVEVYKEGYIPRVFTIELNDHAMHLDIPLDIFNKDNPDNDGSVRGVVIDAATNQPIADSSVHIVGKFTDETLQTDMNGTFVLEHIRSYDLNLSFTAEGYESTQRFVELQKNQHMDMAQIRMRPVDPKSFMPDLQIMELNTSGTVIDPQVLELSGTLSVKVANHGGSATETGFSILSFYDVNGDGNYTEGVDDVLGTTIVSELLDKHEDIMLHVPLSGNLPFVNAPISVWIDARTEIVERDEENNVVSTNTLCCMSDKVDFTPKLKWKWSDYYFNNMPLVIQTNDDNLDGKIDKNDIPDVIVTNSINTYTLKEGNINILSGKNGSVLKHIKLNSETIDGIFYSFAIGDIDNDGLVEVIGRNVKSVNQKNMEYIFAYDVEGNKKLEFVTEAKNLDNHIALADMNNDGFTEIFADHSIIDHNGNELLSFPYVHAAHEILFTNLDQDDALELISGKDVFDNNGSKLFDMGGYGYEGYAIGDIDNDKDPEIIVSCFYYTGYMRVFEADGTLKWHIKMPSAYFSSEGAPALGDIDGDHIPEIVVVGGSYVVAYDHNGILKWQTSIETGIDASTPVLFDFDYDGKYEIIVSTYKGLYILDGSGNLLYKMENTSRVSGHTISIADIDNDGHADLLVPYTAFGGDDPAKTGLRVFSNPTWAGARGVWNQDNYYIDNVNDDGTIPRVENKSWLTHNTFGAQLAYAPNRKMADLSLSLLTVEDQESGIHVHVRVGNGGLDAVHTPVSVALYDGDPSNGGMLLGEANITALNVGAYTDVVLENIQVPQSGILYAVVDPTESINDCTRKNNTLFISLDESRPYASLNIMANKLQYEENERVSIEMRVTNLGRLDANLSTALTLTDTEGNTIYSFAAHDLGVVPSQESRTVYDEWNTTDTMADAYLLKGELFDRNGVIVAESNTSFEIVSGTGGVLDASLGLQLERVRCHTTDSVEMTMHVRNLSSNGVIDNAQLLLRVNDANGTQIHTQTLMLGTLLPNASRDVPYMYGYEHLLPGTYRIEALLQDADGKVYATDTKRFEVYEDFTQAYKGSITVAWHESTVGTAQTCRYSVSNFGATPVSRLPVTIEVIDLSSGLRHQDVNRTVDLNVTQTVSGEIPIDTHGYTIGEHACVLYVEEGVERVRADSAVFAVTNTPPEAVDDSVQTYRNESVLVDVLANDSDVEDGTVALAGFEQPAHGMVVREGDALRYTPETGFEGTDSFEYNVTDTAGAQDRATVFVEVLPPPIEMRMQIVQKPTGRMLVLVDPCSGDKGCGLGCACGDMFSFRFGTNDGVSCEEPNGPEDAVGVDEQALYALHMLKKLGLSVQFSYDNPTFLHALQSGGFNMYAILSETVRLDTDTQRILREFVFGGENMLIAGMHDHRNALIDTLLDVRYGGWLRSVETVETDDENLSYLHTPLLDRSFPVRLQNGSEHLLMHYNLRHCFSSRADAAVEGMYGKGKMIVAGFDLLAEAASAPEEEFSVLFEALVRRIGYDTADQNNSALVGVEITLFNDRMATPAEVTVYVDGGEAVDAPDANESNGTTVRFIEPMMEEASEVRHRLWIRRNTEEMLVVKAEVYSLLDGERKLQTQAQWQLEAQETVEIARLIDDAKAIELRYRLDRIKLKRAIYALERAVTYRQKVQYVRMLRTLLDATDRLESIKEKEKVRPLREAVGGVIKAVSRIVYERGEE